MKIKKNNIRKIDLSLINITDNIRKQYDDIESLARSIEKHGQLEPIGIIEKDDETFDLLYGFRRYQAMKFLVNEKKDFNLIEAKITTGNPMIIQMVENIQRDDLKPAEFEDGLQAFIELGYSKKEIADQLDIRLTRVSDALAARKIRISLKNQGVDTDKMSTSAVSALRAAPKKKQKEAAIKAKEKGGTVEAVKEATGKKKKKEPVYIKEEPEIIIIKSKEKDKNKTEIVIDPRKEKGKKILKDLQDKTGGKLDLVSSEISKDEEEVEIKADIVLTDEINNFIPVILESPYKSDDIETLKRNIDYAKKCCKDCISRGESPLASHLLFTRFLNEQDERETGLQAAKSWYQFAKYCVVYTDNGITNGMQEGIDYIESIGKKIVKRKLNA